jgi:hypothetical protein
MLQNHSPASLGVASMAAFGMGVEEGGYKGAGSTEGVFGGCEMGVKLETGSPRFSTAQVSPQALAGPDTGQQSRGNPPRGRPVYLTPGPRSPPLPRIVLAPEQSQSGHLIPVCRGSWLSPQPFDWAAVMRERDRERE